MLRSEPNKLCDPNKLCFMEAHHGCREKYMLQLKQYIKQELQIKPERCRYSSQHLLLILLLCIIYYTVRYPFTGKKTFVEKAVKNKDKQKRIIAE